MLAPADAEAINQYAQFLSTVGQLEPALREIERAEQLDPLSPIIGVIHAGALDSLKRDGAAEAQIKETLAAYPEFRAAQAWAAAQYIEHKMYPEAEAALRASGKLNGQNGDAKTLIARGVADPVQRAAGLNSLITSPDNADIRQDPILYAFYLISMGERGRALDQLEIYADKHNSAFAGWLWNRGFDPLRDDPRFKALLAKLVFALHPTRRHRAMSEKHSFFSELKRRNVYRVAVAVRGCVVVADPDRDAGLSVLRGPQLGSSTRSVIADFRFSRRVDFVVGL